MLNSAADASVLSDRLLSALIEPVVIGVVFLKFRRAFSFAGVLQVHSWRDPQAGRHYRSSFSDDACSLFIMIQTILP